MKRLFSVLLASLLVYGCGGGGSSSNNNTSPPPAISVSLSPSTQTSLDLGQTLALTATVTNDSSAKGVTWTVSGTGCSGAACGTLTNTTTTTATYNTPASVAAALTVTVTATSVTDTTKSAASTVLVNAISVSLSPSAQTSLDISQTLALTAAVTNDSSSKGVTWTLAGTGCSGAACGSLTNTTTTTATYNTPASVTASLTVTVTATSATDTSKSAASTVVVNSAPSITTKSLANGLVGTAYSATLAATGGTGTLTWTVASGSLPTGLSLKNTGGIWAISGTPTAAQPFTFTVKVTDAASTPVSETQALSVTIYSPLTISTTALPGGAVGVQYSQPIASSGGTAPITWSWTSSTAPPGFQLTMSGASATLSGMPTQSGPFTVTVTATDSSSPVQTAEQTYTLTFLNITTTSLPNGSVGASYSQPLAATGGTGTLTWTLATGTLPTGLALSSGTISGNPNYPGVSSFTVKVTDADSNTKTQALSLTIDGSAGGALSISTTSLPAGTVGKPYTGSIAVSGGTPPYAYTVSPSTGLPAGLSFNASTGQISGTPTVTGVSSFTLSVTDHSVPPLTAGPQALSITINTPPGATCSTSSGNEAVLSGQYAFTLGGFNGAGFLAVAGAFTADGTGKITGGEADTNGVLGFLSSAIDPTQSIYSVGGDNRGCATIVTTFGTFTTRFALGSISGTPAVATKGNLIEFEKPSSSAYIASGQILQQNTAAFSAGLSGSYVIGYTGWDFTALKPTATAGVMSVPTSGQLETADLYQNDGGYVSEYQPLIGTYSSFDSYGRTIATFTTKGTTGGASLVYYMVSGSNLVAVSASGSPSVIGQLQQQTVPSGGFTNASINGKAVMYGNGANGATAGDSFMGLLNSTVSGTVSVSEYDDNGALNSSGGTGWQALQTANTYTCTYSVAANGLATLSGADPNCSGAPRFYLTGTNAGVLLGQGTSVDLGALEPQANLTFNSGTLAGIFFSGPLEAVNQNQETEVDQVRFASPTVTFTSDSTSTAGPQQIDNTIGITYTVNADGTVSAVQGSSTIVQFIIINSNRFVMINEVPEVYPYIMIGQQ